ncbi:MAG: hypothetical protein HY245_04995 [Rhizobiales bacterium]|nr:hypothetical protein [Hyphomicrobiales bacterium]
MATLSSALNLAFSGLATSAAQTALVSRNVSNANDPDYTRKTANIITLPGGATSIASYDRSADKRLLDKLLDVTSGSAGRQTVLDALTRLAETIGDPQSDGSTTALIGKLQESLKAYEANPADATLGSSVMAAARNLTTALNQASVAVQQVRATADQDMAASVSRINALLDQFKVARGNRHPYRDPAEQ